MSHCNKNILQVSFCQFSTVHCKMCEKQETIPVSTFKKRSFANDFTIESETEKVISALCKYCFSINYNNLMQKVKYQNLKGSALKSVNFIVTYEKLLMFISHIGINTSLHNWCKEKVTGQTKFCLIVLVKKDRCLVEQNTNEFTILLY